MIIKGLVMDKIITKYKNILLKISYNNRKKIVALVGSYNKEAYKFATSLRKGDKVSVKGTGNKEILLIKSISSGL